MLQTVGQRARLYTEVASAFKLACRLGNRMHACLRPAVDQWGSSCVCGVAPVNVRVHAPYHVRSCKDPIATHTSCVSVWALTVLLCGATHMCP